jgi:hypothetical protein
MRATLVLTAAVLVGCEHGDIYYSGNNIPDHFPLDGSLLVWKYDSEATSDHLTVEKSGSEVLDDREVVTLAHTLTDEDGSRDWVADIRWSSDRDAGVLIHGYTQGEERLDLDPPVILSERYSVPGDVLTTYSNGQGWISRFEGIEGCGNFWVPEWDDESCLVFSLDDGDDDPETNGLITGTYHLVPRYGAAWLDLDAYDVRWRLSDHDWEE